MKGSSGMMDSLMVEGFPTMTTVFGEIVGAMIFWILEIEISGTPRRDLIRINYLVSSS